MTTTRKMRGERISSIRKPGWESLITLRRVACDEIGQVTPVGEATCFDYSEQWVIRFNEKKTSWFLVSGRNGLAIGTRARMTRMTRVVGTPTSLARIELSERGEFWAHVLRNFYGGIDPQCEDCSDGSPVPHFPFRRDHRIHCTCRGCF